MVERDFTLDGRMKPITDKEIKRKLRGFLPFFSLDTREEVDAVIARAIEKGEISRQADGTLVEMTLLYEQTLENLELAGARLAYIAEEIATGETK